jgi:hypothetical protein
LEWSFPPAFAIFRAAVLRSEAAPRATTTRKTRVALPWAGMSSPFWEVVAQAEERVRLLL